MKLNDAKIMNDSFNNRKVLLLSARRLTLGEGLISGILALALSTLCLLGALAFHFPEYLTTPELRQRYDVSILRQLMFFSMSLAGALSLFNLVIVGFQAVFNHANVSVCLGPLRYIVVTPNFHHWHHSRDSEAIDKNYAAHFAFIDYLFGTAVSSHKIWPERYGVVGSYVPNGYWRQFIFPFFGNTSSRESAPNSESDNK